MPHLVVGTAGHIDHGKSALVRALTGTDPDRLKEEKARGITIDLGFAHVTMDGVHVAFVDVPGHERFVKNMLAGATGIDAVLLVVSAEESVMPQTREHFDICRLLGLRHGLVVLTKADLVDRDTVDLVTLEVRDLLAGSFLDNAPVIAASAVTGEGLDAVRAALAALSAATRDRRATGVTRLPIDRVFSVRGFGTVVTGTLVSGRLATDQDVELLPSGRRVKVRGLHAHGAAVEEVSAGQRVAVNLAGVEVGDLARGETLASPGALVPSRVLDAEIDLLASARPLKHGARVRFHFGTSELLGRVAVSSTWGGAPVSHAERAVEPAGEVRPGGSARVRVRLESAAVITRGDRFILRAYSPAVTIAGGTVLDPAPPRGPLRTPAGQSRFESIAWREGDALPGAFLRQVLTERAAHGTTAAALVSRAGVDQETARAALASLVSAGEARQIGALTVSSRAFDELARRLEGEVRAYHQQHPLSTGLPREEARARAVAHADPAVFEAAVDELVTARRLAGRERLALHGFGVALSGEDERALRGVETAFADAGLAPPDESALAAALGVAPASVQRAMTLLLRQRTLVKVGGLVFHAAALERLKSEVRGLKGAPGGARIDVAAFKERYGVSRKFAIPLLEHLDRERVTRRVGDARIVL